MAEEAVRPGVRNSLKALARNLLDTTQTRLQLLSSELEEQGARLLKIIALAAIGGFLLALAIVLAVFFIVVLFWDSHPLLAVGLLSGGFLIGAVIVFMMVKSELDRRPPLLHVTIDEFHKDKMRLQ
ncbi:MAG: phage holin family protein [Betaproteobacteria bacterium]|nr:phage holin family protein [Betaproteobacteria bacterium]